MKVDHKQRAKHLVENKKYWRNEDEPLYRVTISLPYELFDLAGSLGLEAGQPSADEYIVGRIEATLGLMKQGGAYARASRATEDLPPPGTRTRRLARSRVPRKSEDLMNTTLWLREELFDFACAMGNAQGKLVDRYIQDLALELIPLQAGERWVQSWTRVGDG